MTFAGRLAGAPAVASRPGLGPWPHPPVAVVARPGRCLCGLRLVSPLHGDAGKVMAALPVVTRRREGLVTLVALVLPGRRKPLALADPVYDYLPLPGGPALEDRTRALRAPRHPDPLVFGPEEAMELQGRGPVYTAESCGPCGVRWRGGPCWVCKEEPGTRTAGGGDGGRRDGRAPRRGLLRWLGRYLSGGAVS